MTESLEFYQIIRRNWDELYALFNQVNEENVRLRQALVDAGVPARTVEIIAKGNNHSLEQGTPLPASDCMCTACSGINATKGG